MTRILAFSRKGTGKAHNEDALIVGNEVLQGSICQEWEMPSPNTFLVAVSDGVAIGTNPRRASRDLLLLLSLSEIPKVAVDNIPQRLRLLQEQYASISKLHPELTGMAATLVGVVLQGRHYTVFNVGDSRAYVLDASGGIRQLSHDHTQIQEMIDTGEVTIEQARNAATIYDQLTSHFLAESDFQEFMVHVTRYDLQDGERLILCSDGFYEALSNDEMADLLAPCSLAALQKLYREARRRGSTDDFTVIAIT